MRTETDHGYCPRCGVVRPDAFRWCRKCGFDFENPPKPDPAPQGPAVRTQDHVDVRLVNDRRTMAQWTRDAFTIRCLGTIGGLLGAFVGFIVFAWIGVALGAGPWSLLLALIGIPIGFFVGVRIALGRLAQ